MDTLTLALEKVDLPPPDRVTDDTSVLTLKSLVLEPMTVWRPGGTDPALLAGWTRDATARQWRFPLREGATFHDGRPVRAGDLVAMIEAICNGRDTFGMKWAYATYFETARFAEAPDGALSVTCDDPIADLPEILSDFHLAGDDGTLGTGPWRVAEFERGERAVLERLGPGAPARLTCLAIPDPEARLAALRSGRADAATHLERVAGPPPDLQGLDALSVVSPLSVMAYLNCRKGPFAEPALRRAANLAIDRRRLVDEVFQGRAAIAGTVVSPAHVGQPTGGLPGFRHDPAEARALVAAHGAPKLTLRTPTHMPDRAPELAAAIAAGLEAAGFAVSVQTDSDRPGYARRIGAGDMGDIALFDSSPHSTFRVLQDKILSDPPGPWWQGYADARVDELIHEAARTADDASRAEVYRRCLARLADDPPWLYLVHPVETAAMRPGLPFALDARGALVMT